MIQEQGIFKSTSSRELTDFNFELVGDSIGTERKYNTLSQHSLIRLTNRSIWLQWNLYSLFLKGQKKKRWKGVKWQLQERIKCVTNTRKLQKMKIIHFPLKPTKQTNKTHFSTCVQIRFSQINLQLTTAALNYYISDKEVPIPSSESSICHACESYAW